MSRHLSPLPLLAMSGPKRRNLAASAQGQEADIAVPALDPILGGYGNSFYSVYPAKPGSPGSEANFPAKPTHLVRAVIQETRWAPRYFFSATALFRSVSFAAKTKVTARSAHRAMSARTASVLASSSA